MVAQRGHVCVAANLETGMASADHDVAIQNSKRMFQPSYLRELSFFYRDGGHLFVGGGYFGMV